VSRGWKLVAFTRVHIYSCTCLQGACRNCSTCPVLKSPCGRGSSDQVPLQFSTLVWDCCRCFPSPAAPQQPCTEREACVPVSSASCQSSACPCGATTPAVTRRYLHPFVSPTLPGWPDGGKQCPRSCTPTSEAPFIPTHLCSESSYALGNKISGGAVI